MFVEFQLRASTFERSILAQIRSAAAIAPSAFCNTALVMYPRVTIDEALIAEHVGRPVERERAYFDSLSVTQVRLTEDMADSPVDIWWPTLGAGSVVPAIVPAGSSGWPR